jgi:hypothetical protein
LSTVPWEALFVTEETSPLAGAAFKLLRVLKVARIRKIPGIIRYMNADLEFKTYLRIVTTILYLIIYFHLFACMLWLTFAQDGYTWWPPLDFMFYPSKDDPSFFFTPLNKRNTMN